MLRSTHASLNYRATLELDRVRGLLRGRARLERKVGVKRLTFLMRTQTRYRVEKQSYWERSIVRKNVDSAAHEHGSAWSHLRNDIARQNMMLLPRTQQHLAQYEPLAFRAVMELCASRIAPPPPPQTAKIPAEAYTASPKDNRVSHPAAARELREAVQRFLAAGKGSVVDAGGSHGVDDWLNAWKEYEVVPGRQ